MMTQQDPEFEPFSKVIAALDPWLEQVVLVGGCAHRLYRNCVSYVVHDGVL
jgi:hypothetical protein